MKIKILYLGRSAKEVDLSENATVMQAIVEAGYPQEGHYSRHLNGHPVFDTDVLHPGDVLTLVPPVKGGC